MKNDIRTLGRFFCLFRSQWIPYIIATLVVASRNFIITFINAKVSSGAIAAVSTNGSLAEPLVNILILVICFALFDAAGIYFQTVIIHKISMVLRGKMFSHALNVSVSDIDRFGRRDELVSRMNFDIDSAVGLLSYGLLSPIMCCVSGIGATAIVFRENLKIGAAVYLLGTAALLAQILLVKLLRKTMTRIQEERSAILSVSMQTFLNAAGIKMANMVDYLTGMHRSRISRYNRTYRKKGKVDGAYGLMEGTLQLACFFGVFCYSLFGAGMALERAVFISQLTPLIAAMLLSLSGCIASVQRSMVGISRILELFGLPLEEDAGEEFAFRPAEKGIEARGLVCCYGDTSVHITDITLKPDAGNIIALSGPSGCGKTTLLRLLLKLYPCSQGSLRFFGQDVRGCSPVSIRKNIAYVPQENVIFPGTIRENLLLGNPRSGVTDTEIQDVLQQIGADGWTAQTGLDSPLKEDGANLSGGQRQMIAIARALLYRRPVLVLDESFASVDAEHIRTIMELLAGMKDSLYVIIVTHDSRVMQQCSTTINVRLER